MDNTINGQNPQQQNPSQSGAPQGQNFVPGVNSPDPNLVGSNATTIPVQPVSQMTQPDVPQILTGTSQPVSSPVSYSGMQPMPPANPVPQQPVDQGKKITLEDLYGPSGLTTNTGDLSPLSSSAVPAVPAINPQPPEPVVPPPQEIPQFQQSPVAAELPTEPVQKIDRLVQEQASQSEQPVIDLPLRKTGFSMPPAENKVESPTLKPQETPKPSEPPQKKDGKLNKLSLMRIIFGIVAGIIVVALIIFGFQMISSRFQPSTSGKATLTYWGLWEDANTMQVIISQFEKTHPDITIQYEKQDPKDYSQRLMTRVQQGNGPDVFAYHSSWLPMVLPILVPLPTTVVSKNDLENSFYPVVSRDLVKNGALYGVPLEVDTLSLFVNNKMFADAKAQVPSTWDTFVTTARALTVKDENGKIKVAGAAIGTYDNITHAPDILSTLFMQNGVDVTTMTPKSNAADALSFYTSFASGNSAVWDNTLDPSQLAFARGNLAMYFGYSWDVFLIKASNPNLDFSIYPIPHLPGRNTTAASYWVQGVSAKSTHQKEALIFMQYLAEKDTAATLYSEEAKTRLFGEPYAQIDLGETLKSSPLVYPFVKQASDAKSTFFAGETFDTALNGQMNGYLGNAVRGVLGNTSADSAIDTLTQGVLQIEKQYGSG